MPTKLALAAPVADGPLLAMADALEPKLIRGFVRALTSMRDRVSVDEVLELLTTGQFDRVLELFAPDEFTVAKVTKAERGFGPDSEFLASIYQSLFEDGGNHATQELRAFGAGMDFRINRDDAARWAEQHAGSQIVQIQRETRQIVQQMIAMGIREGVPPRTLATQIAHSVGLTPQHAVALRNFTTAAEQAAAQGGSVGWMRDRWSLSPQWSGRPASVESAVNRYSDRLISWRAETIARTETLTSLHQGQLEGWREMERSGLFEHQKVVRHWQISNDDRLCDVCAPMAGETSTLSEKWQSTERGLPGGETVEHTGPVVETPPLHPRCRCTEFITLEVARTDERNVPGVTKPTTPAPGRVDSSAYRTAREAQPDQLGHHGRLEEFFQRTAIDGKTQGDRSWETMYFDDLGYGERPKALERWVVDDDRTLAINNKLREGEALTQAETKWADTLEDVISRVEFTDDVRVYRGAWLSDDVVGALQPGTQFTDDAFMAAAPNPNTAMMYLDAREAGNMTGVLWEIDVGRGVHAALAAPDEIVLARGHSLMIKEVTRDADGILHVVCEVV